MKYWKLPDDELADLRKERHREFHVDESAIYRANRTTNRQRNWTFGKATFKLID